MKTDTEIRQEGLIALTERLGPVDAEKFITLILRQPFDYTEWQKGLWPDESLAELNRKAMAFNSE